MRMTLTRHVTAQTVYALSIPTIVHPYPRRSYPIDRKSTQAGL